MLHLQLHPQAEVSEEPGNGYRVELFGQTHRFYPASPELSGAVHAFLVGGVTPSAAQEMVRAQGADDTEASWHDFLDRVTDGALVSRTVHDGQRPLATLVPLSPKFRYAPAIDPTLAVELSRFAHVRRVGERLELHMPLAEAELRLSHPDALQVIDALGARRLPAQIVERCPALSAAAIEGLLQLLSAMRAISQGPLEGPTEEDRRIPFPWQFHDMLMHDATRVAGLRSGSPGNFRFGDKSDNPFEDPYASLEVLETIALAPPSAEELAGDARPFLEVVAARRSQRDHAREPITRRELAAFLYRVFNPRTEQEFMGVATELRPYPAGGAIFELDPWIAVNRCEGLEPGLYRYDLRAHALQLIAGMSPAINTILTTGASYSGVNPVGLHAVLLLVGCPPKLAYKYTGIGYCLMLKNLGVLMAHISLVAAAMGLATCLLGNGTSEAFAEASGLDVTMATTVGELTLGRPADPR